MKVQQLLMHKHFLAVVAIAIFVVVIALGTQLAQFSITGQSGAYTITAVGSDGVAISGAQVSLLDPSGSGEWLNMGTTDQFGQVRISGWEGLTLQASYNGVSNTGVFVNQPQTLTITLPMAGNSHPQPTQPPVTTYNFALDVNPRESGIIGVTSSDGSTLLQSGYPAGTVLTLNALHISPYTFSSFTVNGQTYTSSTIQVTINSPTTVTANFVIGAPPTSTPTPSPTPWNPLATETPPPTQTPLAPVAQSAFLTAFGVSFTFLEACVIGAILLAVIVAIVLALYFKRKRR